MADRVPTCVWPLTDGLILALDEHLGAPDDAYVNGTQVWLRPLGDDGPEIEWRLHPAAGFESPTGVSPISLFEDVALALATDAEPPAPPESLWDGLEAYPAFGDDLEPATLRRLTGEVLGLPSPFAGMVDHEPIATAWEAAAGRMSVIGELVRQLGDDAGGHDD